MSKVKKDDEIKAWAWKQGLHTPLLPSLYPFGVSERMPEASRCSEMLHVLGTTESPEHICAGSGQEDPWLTGRLPSLLIHILTIHGAPYAQTRGMTFQVQPHRTLNFNPTWKADKADIRAAIEFRHM